jgi:hypothetical protein
MPLYRATLNGVFPDGRTWSSRLTIGNAAATASFLATWATALTNFWTDGTHGVETLYPVGTVLEEATAAVLDSTMREGEKLTQSLALPGTNVGDSLPAQDAILVSLRGAAVGKKNRGRMYLPGPADTVAIVGEMDNTSTTRVSTAINALFNDMRAAGSTFYVYNAKANAHDPVPFVLKVITTEKVDRFIRSQRRRQEKNRAVYV